MHEVYNTETSVSKENIHFGIYFTGGYSFDCIGNYIFVPFRLELMLFKHVEMNDEKICLYYNEIKFRFTIIKIKNKNVISFFTKRGKATLKNKYDISVK